MGSHHSLSLLGWTSPLAPPNGPEEPVWGLWQGHTGCPTPRSSQLQKRHVRSAEGSESGEEGRANPVNQPNQLKSHGWTRESAMSQPAPLHPCFVCVPFKNLWQSRLLWILKASFSSPTVQADQIASVRAPY